LTRRHRERGADRKIDLFACLGAGSARWLQLRARLREKLDQLFDIGSVEMDGVAVALFGLHGQPRELAIFSNADIELIGCHFKSKPHGWASPL
jgi:hypothetical protein